MSVEVNGTTYEREVEARRLLIHFLRDDLDLTGSHVGCDTGNCGACSVIFDGTLVKSCMLLAVQADGATIETVEGLAQEERAEPAAAGVLSDHHALQCGYCTPGMLMSATALLRENPRPSDEEIAKAIQGNICTLHGLLEHLQGGQGRVRPGGRRVSETTTIAEPLVVEEAETKPGYAGQSVPAQGGQAARPGRGRLLRRRQAAQHGLRPLRPLAVRAREAPLGRRLEGARASRACSAR